MKKISMIIAVLMVFAVSACSQGNKAKESKEMNGRSSIKKACEDLKATYPDVFWKEGKLLNRASKKDLEDWVKNL